MTNHCKDTDPDAEEYYGSANKCTRTSLGASGRKSAIAPNSLYSSPWMTAANKSCLTNGHEQESTYCNTPNGSFMPSSPFGQMSKVSATPTVTNLKENSPLPMTPPRVDRQSKPARFKSAYERLFGRSDSSPNKTTEFVFGGALRANTSPLVDDGHTFSRESTTSPDYINSSQLCNSRNESLGNNGSQYSSGVQRNNTSGATGGGERRESPATCSYGYSNGINGPSSSSSKQTSVKYQSFYSEIRKHEKANASSHQTHSQQQML